MNYLEPALRLEPREPVRVRPQRPSQHTASIGPWGFDMEVVYEYDPGEEAVLWGDYPHPGSPANCSLVTASVGGVDITEMLVDRQILRIEEKLLEDYE